MFPLGCQDPLRTITTLIFVLILGYFNNFVIGKNFLEKQTKKLGLSKNFTTFSLPYSNERPIEIENAPYEGLEKLLKCYICKITFNSLAEVRRHFEQLHKEFKPFKCDICDTTFTRANKVEKHKKVFHEEMKPVKCDICDKIFKRPAEMKRHFESEHENEKPFKCEYCDARFTYTQTLNKHIRTSHDENKPIFECIICETKLSSANGLKMHLEKIHEQVENLTKHGEKEADTKG